ncbi:MAG: TRAP transporter substrate-binding protein DctP [Treponema sp.]|nr:TRAP transporter substrate-binding protein DctP [Treponema sp.]
MKRIAFITLAIFSLLYTNTVFAQRGSASQSNTVDVRLASFMPRNSDWGRTLDRMSAEWARVTNNAVRLRVIHDGLEGGEQKTLSSMSTNNIQAALFTSFGLHNICPSVMTMSAPFLIRSEAELDLVLKDARPLLDTQVNKTNFVVLAWSKGGWVNIFSKEPIMTPDDLRRQKMATNPDDSKLNAAFKAMGFNLIETEIIDLGPKIASNSINAFYQTPASVAPLGLYKQLGNMMDIPIAPFLGAIVINRVTWNKISPADQSKILQVTQKITSEFEAIMPQMVTNAIAMMQRDGLKVNNVSPAQQQLWYAEIQKATPSLMGSTFDTELYNKINEIVRKSRSGQ